MARQPSDETELALLKLRVGRLEKIVYGCLTVVVLAVLYALLRRIGL